MIALRNTSRKHCPKNGYELSYCLCGSCPDKQDVTKIPDASDRARITKYIKSLKKKSRAIKFILSNISIDILKRIIDYLYDHVQDRELVNHVNSRQDARKQMEKFLDDNPGVLKEKPTSAIPVVPLDHYGGYGMPGVKLEDVRKSS